MRSYKKLVPAAFLLLTLGACNKVLDIDETDLIGGDAAFKTVGNCEQGVIGAYSGVGTEMSILLNATFADEVKKSEFYNAATTHEWQYGSTDVGIRDNFTAINPNYVIIDRVNRVLRALPNADSVKASDNQTLRRRVRGECLFLRAYAHFELFRYYCGTYSPTGLAMPYMTTPSVDTQGRILMAPYFQQLNADLAEAKTLLPAGLTDKARANAVAATGLQARVALYTRDWANAETFSTEYINALPLIPRNEFRLLWKDSSTKEVAYLIIRNTGNRIGSLFRGTSSNQANIGTVTWQPTNKLWDTYDQVNDIRFASYLLDEPLLTSAGRASRIIRKYAGTTEANATNNYGTALENVANGKVFRTGEMYLIRAEARAEQDRFTGANSAESDLNALRAARIDGYTNVVLASKQAAIDAILLERFKELAFEGHRFWDLKRRGLPVERIPSEAPSATGTTLPAGNYRFLLPIPNVEMQNNVAMVQNPGYN